MINNHHSSQSENNPPISKEELNNLTLALEQASVKIDAVNQPFSLTLKKLAKEQADLVQEITKIEKALAQQQKTLELRAQEITEIRKQISDNRNWHNASVNWPTVIAIMLLSVPAVVSSWFLMQKFVPAQLDSNAIKKIDFLYEKYNQKPTKGSERNRR
jgi:hypothetical protein